MPDHHPVGTRGSAAVRVGLQDAGRPGLESPRAPLTLRHIAIIPDGNRRWAKTRGLPTLDGVRSGVKTAERIFETMCQRGIPWCTFWAGSYDNLTKRPGPERAVLNELFALWFSRLAKNETIHRSRVRVRALGEWADLLTPRARQAIQRSLDATASYDAGSLTFLVGYDGDRELVAATKSLLQAVGSRQQAVESMADLRAHAWTKELPEVDVIIRTGAWEDPHRSANFLPLLTSNVQEAYPKVYWPDFSDAELDAVLADLARRERRLGA